MPGTPTSSPSTPPTLENTIEHVGAINWLRVIYGFGRGLHARVGVRDQRSRDNANGLVVDDRAIRKCAHVLERGARVLDYVATAASRRADRIDESVREEQAPNPPAGFASDGIAERTLERRLPRIPVMEVEIGQTVYVPDPDGNPVRATVIAQGEPGDAVEMNVDGHAVKRDVAIVRHEEGKSQGFIAHVPYDDLKPSADEE